MGCSSWAGVGVPQLGSLITLFLCILCRGPTFQRGFPSVALMPYALDFVPTRPKVWSPVLPQLPVVFLEAGALLSLGPSEALFERKNGVESLILP